MILVMDSHFLPNVVSKARQVFEAMKQGVIHARKSKRLGYRSLSVTDRYRLLNTGCSAWVLMTHSSYNKAIDKR
ncbi:ParE family toxin-like protein [Vibrio owensii]|uniref:ParE family toxin-like protein n=1 Tax=Vibrio owensii TaxID=696485 RepID=UPI003F49ED0F